MKFWILLIITILLTSVSNAQTLPKDSLLNRNIYPATTEGVRFELKQLIIPTILIGAGITWAVQENFDKSINKKISHGDIMLDDILPAAIPASVYVLNWCGVHGKHNFIDRSVILGSASIVGLGTSYLLKNQIISRKRPDHSENNSFPSLHTTAAFIGAEFLYQEFKEKSIWYGITGYGLATCTGFLRMYNNKHWLSDVLAGAGIGILSTKLAYWVYPQIRKLYEGTVFDRAEYLPYITPNGAGISFALRI